MVVVVGGWVDGLSENNYCEDLALPINKYKKNDWNPFLIYNIINTMFDLLLYIQLHDSNDDNLVGLLV